MAGKFVLRSDQDTENPILARFYGDGITAGQVMLYDKISTRTVFLALIAQGARFQGDTGCSKVRRVVYAGFDIPEFDSTGARNWLFHSGLQSKHPVYRRVTMSSNTINDSGNPLSNGQKVSFHKRGSSQTIPSPILTHVQYFVVNRTGSGYQISLTSGGVAISFGSSSGSEIFAYRSDDAGLFDVDQGRPYFFPALDFTFSGKCYIEILLPAELSNGEDEPTRTKLICRGKQVYDIVVSGDSYIDTSGSPIDLEDPALISYDFLKNDLHFPRDRFNGQSWIDWKNRNAGLINWAGGNGNPAQPGSFPTVSGGSYSNGIFTSSSSTNTWAKATTTAFPRQNAMAEAQFNGGQAALRFTSDSAGSVTTHAIYTGTDGISLYYFDGTTSTQIGTVAVSDRLKISFEGGFFFAYQNSIPLTFGAITPAVQPSGNFYISVQVATNGQTLSKILIQPSGTDASPRQVRRYYGDFVSPGLLPVSLAFETMIAICPGVVWQDVDGEITILPDPVRAPVFTFFYEPGSATPSNTANGRIKPRDADIGPNYWRFSYRNKDDAILTKSYTNADRPARRSANGGKKIEPQGGMAAYGVLTPSQIDRIGETVARITSDLDFGFELEAFLDSLIVAKGDYVNVVDPTGGFDHLDPSLQIVLNESFEQTDDVETRNFETQVILTSWYSDTDHGPVVPVTRTTASDRFRSAPYLIALTLTEGYTRLPDATYIPIIEGLATFDPSMFGQSGRIFIKRNLGDGKVVTCNGISTFTIADLTKWTYVNNDAVSILALTAITGTLPVGLAFDTKYYIKGLSGSTFQLSLTPGGTAVAVTTAGVGTLAIFSYEDWTDTGLRVEPEPTTMQVGFEIDNVPRGWHYVRILTVSSGGISHDFDLATTNRLHMLGDQLAPAPPTNGECVFDGLNLTFNWQQSVSPNVAGYYITDETDRVIEPLLQALSYTEVARTLMTTRRIYAVSLSGIRSTTYLTIEFVIASGLDWIDPSGCSVVELGILQKPSTGTSAWNAGASISWSALTPELPIKLRIPPITETNTLRLFGWTRDGAGGAPFVTNPNQFYYGVQLNADGTYSALYGDGVSVSTVSVGSYLVGDQFDIDVIPYTIASDTGTTQTPTFTLSRITPNSDGIRKSTLVFTFPTKSTGSQSFPLFASVAIFTPGCRITPYLTIVGDLIPTQGIIPSWQNVTNINQGAGSSGGVINGVNNSINGSIRSLETILANDDGIWEFRFQDGINAFAGATAIDPAGSANNMSVYIQHLADNTSKIFIDGFVVKTFTAQTGTLFSISRENRHWTVRRNAIQEYISVAPSVGLGAAYFGALIPNSQTFTNMYIDSIYLRQAAPTLYNSSLLKQRPVTATVKAARAGDQSVYNIPIFNVATPTANQVATFDKYGRVVNSSVSGLFPSLITTNGVVYFDGTTLVTDPQFTYNGTTNRLTVDSCLIATPNATSVYQGSAISVSYSGANNTVMGIGAGQLVTAGSENVFIGRLAGSNTTTQAGNTCIGYASGFNLTTTGSNNVSIGSSSLQNCQTGSRSVAVGGNALLSSTASENIGIGFNAGDQITTGTANTFIGTYRLGTTLISGSDNTFIGTKAGQSVIASQNTLIGSNAGVSISSGTQNVCVGYNTAVTSGTASNQTNINNTFFGISTEAWVDRSTFKVRFDASNYLSIIVSSVGLVTFNAVGSAPTFNFQKLVTVDGSTTNSTFRVGGLEVQSFASSANSWIGDNIYWDGSSFKARVTNYTEMIRFLNGSIILQVAASVSAGTAPTLLTGLSMDSTGNLMIARKITTTASLSISPTFADSGTEYRGTHASGLVVNLPFLSGCVLNNTSFWFYCLNGSVDIVPNGSDRLEYWDEAGGNLVAAGTEAQSNHTYSLIEVRYTATNRWHVSGNGLYQP